MERKTKAATETFIYLFIVAAALVVLNVIMVFFNKRIDTTDTERFTLSKGSARLVTEGLKQDLKIEVYATKGLAKTDVFIQDLTDLLKEYENATYKGKDGTVTKSHVHFVIIEPKTDDQKKAAKDAGLQEQTFTDRDAAKSQATFQKGFMGMVFKYGTEQDNIPFWPPDETTGLEFFITNKIRELRDTVEERKMKIGIISGKDELKISDNVIAPSQPGQDYNLKGIFTQYLPFYEFQDVDLQNGDAEINQELRGIVITQPGKDFTEKELRRIDQFLMLGNRSLTIFAGAVNIKAADASMRATLNTHGLEKLLDGYGIEMKKDAILDWTESFALQVQTQGGAQNLQVPWAIQAAPDDTLEADKQILDDSFAPFFRLKQVPIPFASSLVVHKDKQPSTRFRVVARSSVNATSDVSESIDMSLRTILTTKPAGEKGQKVLAVALEAGCCDGTNKCGETDPCKKGTLKSAFSGDNMGVEAAGESAGPANIFVVASSQFLANPFARSGNPPPMPPQMQMMGAMGGDRDLQMIARPYYEESFPWMVMAFKNTLDWMGGEQDLVATSAKLLGAPNLKYTDVKKIEIADTDTPDDIKKKMESQAEQKEALQTKVSWTLAILPVLLFAGLGLLRWWRREATRNSISL